MQPPTYISAAIEMDEDNELHLCLMAEVIGTDLKSMLVMPGGAVPSLITLLQKIVATYPQHTTEAAKEAFTGSATPSDQEGMARLQQMRDAIEKDIDEMRRGVERKPN